MTFERSVIEERLKKLREVLENLEPLRSCPVDEFVSDCRVHWAAERGMQLAAEIVLDVASHILAAVFRTFPETNEGALDALAGHGVISGELHGRLRGLGGLRNVLVHAYLRLDERQVHQHLQSLPLDLTEFIRQVIAWLAGRGYTAG